MTPDQKMPKQRKFPNDNPEESLRYSLFGRSALLIRIGLQAPFFIFLVWVAASIFNTDGWERRLVFFDYVESITPESLTYVTAKFRQAPSYSRAYSHFYLDVAGAGLLVREGLNAAQTRPYAAVCPWMHHRPMRIGAHNCGDVLAKSGGERFFKVGYVRPEQDTGLARNQLLVFYIAELDANGELVGQILTFEQAQANYLYWRDNPQ